MCLFPYFHSFRGYLCKINKKLVPRIGKCPLFYSWYSVFFGMIQKDILTNLRLIFYAYCVRFRNPSGSVNFNIEEWKVGLL